MIATILVGLILFIFLFIKVPVSPDPWDGEVDKEKLAECSQAICLNCSRPV